MSKKAEKSYFDMMQEVDYWKEQYEKTATVCREYRNLLKEIAKSDQTLPDPCRDNGEWDIAKWEDWYLRTKASLYGDK